MRKSEPKLRVDPERERKALIDAAAHMIRRGSEEGQLISGTEIVDRLVDQYLAPKCPPSPRVGEGEGKGDTDALPTLGAGERELKKAAGIEG